MTDVLRAHALELAARLLGDRRGVELGDGAVPDDAEAVLVTRQAPDPDRLRSRLGRARKAAEAGVPVIVYFPTRALEPAGAGEAWGEVRRGFEEVSDAVAFEQHDVEASITGSAGALPKSIEAAPSMPDAPARVLIAANLPVPTGAEARLGWRSEPAPERLELERRLAELRARNLRLARSRLGTPAEDTAGSRARVAERRLLFARVRETVSALLSRRRLRG